MEQTYARAQALCEQLGDTPHRFPTLWGLWRFHLARGTLHTARELGEQLYALVQHVSDPTYLLEAHDACGTTLLHLGNYAVAQRHFEQGISLIDSVAQRTQALRYGVAPGLRCLAYAAHTLWCLGYPEQGARRSRESLALAQELAHPYSLMLAQFLAAFLHYRRREASVVQTCAEALLTLATTQEFPLWAGLGTCWRAWALAVQGQGRAGLDLLHQGYAAVLATGQGLSQPLCLILMAEAAGYANRLPEGLQLLEEALATIETSGREDLRSEAYRHQGVLLLRQAVPDVMRAEACFQQALQVARQQQAKSWELRAAISLCQLWQRYDKRAEAYDLLAPLYGWFMEGFATADLQQAKALLDALQA